MHLGDVIKQYRHDHGKMSMQAFADKCGLSKGYIAMLERNKNSKTGEPVVPSVETFAKVADAMGITLDEISKMVDENQPISLSTHNIISKQSMLYNIMKEHDMDPEDMFGTVDAPTWRAKTPEPISVRIPVLGSIPAGIPLEAVEDVVDWEDIPIEWTKGGKEFFSLKVKGDSMYPKFIEGDTIILRKQDDCENGDICAVYVNGYDATLKKVVKKQDCIVLQPLNSAYDPKVYDYNDELNPIQIAGVVVEIRRKV